MSTSREGNAQTGRWLAAGLAIVLGALAAWFWGQKALREVPGAYVVPLSEGCRVHAGVLGGPLLKPRVLRGGDTLKVDPGSEVAVLKLDGTVDRVKGPALVSVPEPTSGDRDYLRSSLGELLRTEDDHGFRSLGIRVFSPYGVTRFVNPPLEWAKESGKKYDLAVVDPADENAPLKLAKDVDKSLRVSDLDTSGHRRLRKDRLYEFWIREADKQDTLVQQRFLVSPEATEGDLPASPGELVVLAFQSLSKTPFALGDAHMAVKALPATWRETELGLRLRWAVAAQLDMGEEVANVRKEASKR